MARSSRGEDARFSFWKQGFDSPTGYKKPLQSEAAFFISHILEQGFAPIAIGTPSAYEKHHSDKV